jgi:hypothetical protein
MVTLFDPESFMTVLLSVILLAVKFPLESRFTIALAVLALVAALANCSAV